MAASDSIPTRSVADPRVRLTIASGGWVLIVAGIVCLALTTWAVWPAITRMVERPPGDGTNVESYGFALQPSLVPPALIAPVMLHRDMIPVADDPDIAAGATIGELNAKRRGKVLVSSDRVVGVEIAGEARAYPIHLLNVHEIVNDTLGGVPIAVTYNWPCDSVMVFDRRIDDHVASFAVSGLAYNCNLLMYDRHDASPTGESLWSQLLTRAVTGPAAAAGAALRTRLCTVTGWSDWLEHHPATTVMLPDPTFEKRYKHASPASYFLTDALLAPVDPMPPADGPDAKRAVVAVETATTRIVFEVETIRDLAGDDGVWRHRVGETDLEFRPVPGVSAVVVTAVSGGPDPMVIPALWFAWHAIHPDDVLYRP